MECAGGPAREAKRSLSSRAMLVVPHGDGLPERLIDRQHPATLAFGAAHTRQGLEAELIPAEIHLQAVRTVGNVAM
jgi:hypothetical protein